MKNISLMILALALSVGVIAGCTEKKQPAEKPKEAATQIVESVGEKPAEVKEAAPVAPAETKEKAVEKKAAVAVGAEEKAAKKPQAPGKGVEAGAAIFKTKCSPCHGADGKGTAMAPAFKGNDWVKGAANGEIADVIKNGREGAAKKYKNFVISMPANKGMAESDINALVEYIKSIN
ncbi:MAG: c-type cytochrome [Deltaproteobacteria bacterium]|nr:c-type cytochrome [Deltaproteobacteria bacterium]